MALDPTALRDLFDRVAVGDVAWIRDRFQAGELDGLREHLDNATWRELPTRLQAGDVAWVRVALSGMQLPGVGAAEALRRGDAGLAGATVAAGFAGLGGAADPADADHLTHAREVRAHLADGDLSWLRAGYRSERLDWLRDHLTNHEWADLSRRLDAGDVGWVRRVVGGVVVPGVGLLGASELVTEGPVTWTPPRHDRGDRRPGWLLPAGVVVTVLAVLALLLSQCDSGGSSTAPSTVVATSASPTIAVSTTAAATTSTAAPATTPAPTTTVAGRVDLVATAAGTPTFSTLTKALAAAEVTDTLKAAGPFTLFAPSDAAFAKLPAGTLEALLKSKADLAKVLTYHVVPGRLTTAQLVAGDLKTVEGDSLKVALTNGKVTVNDATVSGTDVPATNGVIHVIDTVLLPPGFTGPGAATAPPVGTVLEVATADGRFTTLLKALTAAGLENTLKGGGPFTVFAPTDDAFTALGDGVADRLLTDKATLSKLLTYHVVAGKLTSDTLKIGPVRTVAGSNVTIGVTGGKVSVNDAKVVTPDVAATNGIIHVIDKVLVPEGIDLSKLAATPTTTGPSTTVAPTTTTAAPATTSTSSAPATTTAPGAQAWTVYFDSDSATLRADALATIRDAAPRIPNGARVSLVGVADTRGNAEANQKLSADRAGAVQKAFENAGVKAIFTITAKGAEPNNDLQKARRVEISIG